MILFKPEHKPMILNGQKTQTRRKGKRRWNVGSRHMFYTKPAWSGGDPFASARITGVRQERLEAITQHDALAEGYPSVEDYFIAYRRIYKIKDEDWRAELFSYVWVVDFTLTKEQVTCPGTTGSP